MKKLITVIFFLSCFLAFSFLSAKELSVNLSDKYKQCVSNKDYEGLLKEISLLDSKERNIATTKLIEAKSLMNLKKFKEADDVLEFYSDKSNFEFLFTKAQLSFFQKDFNTSERYLSTIDEIFPYKTEVCLLKGDIALEKKNITSALEQYLTALKEDYQNEKVKSKVINLIMSEATIDPWSEENNYIIEKIFSERRLVK